MNIKYSKHIRIRLALRKIDHDLPRQIFEDAAERFADEETGHTIAVGKARLYEKERDVMFAYRGQKEHRIGSGRWRKLQ